ncbi:MAG: SPOR domain-containing protein [Steroidobacteraceae bacterium]
MDTALRNRLTGAALLILLAVILLPEMLTGEGGSRSAATQTVEGVEQPVQSYDFDLSEQAQVPTPPAVEAPVPSSSPTVTPPATTPIAPQTRAAEVPVATTPAAETPETGYFVQIGVFSNKASADRLARELRQKKFTVVVAQLDGAKPLHRVRVGPAADRKAAEALAKRLAAAGHKGSVVSTP